MIYERCTTSHKSNPRPSGQWESTTEKLGQGVETKLWNPCFSPSLFERLFPCEICMCLFQSRHVAVVYTGLFVLPTGSVAYRAWAAKISCMNKLTETHTTDSTKQIWYNPYYLLNMYKQWWGTWWGTTATMQNVTTASCDNFNCITLTSPLWLKRKCRASIMHKCMLSSTKYLQQTPSSQTKQQGVCQLSMTQRVDVFKLLLYLNCLFLHVSGLFLLSSSWTVARLSGQHDCPCVGDRGRFNSKPMPVVKHHTNNYIECLQRINTSLAAKCSTVHVLRSCGWKKEAHLHHTGHFNLYTVRSSEYWSGLVKCKIEDMEQMKYTFTSNFVVCQ